MSEHAHCGRSQRLQEGLRKTLMKHREEGRGDRKGENLPKKCITEIMEKTQPALNPNPESSWNKMKGPYFTVISTCSGK